MTTTVESGPTQLNLLTVDVDPAQFAAGPRANYEDRAILLANIYTARSPASTAIRKIGDIADRASFSAWQDFEGGQAKCQIDLTKNGDVYQATTDGVFAPYADLISSALGYQLATFPDAKFNRPPGLVVMQGVVKRRHAQIPKAEGRHHDFGEDDEWLHVFTVADRSPTISWQHGQAHKLQPYEIGFHDTSTEHASPRLLFGGLRTFAMMCFYLDTK